MPTQHMQWSPAGGSSPRICGHRGDSANAPENTIEALVRAHAAGASWVEFDARPAADQFVVHHDPVTADGRHVATTPHSELDGSIPTLTEFVTTATGLGLGLDIELKTDDTQLAPEDYVERVGAELGPLVGGRPNSQWIVTSFDQVVLDAFHGAYPTAPTGVLFYEESGEWAIDRAISGGHVSIVPWHPLVTGELVDAAHAHGLAVLTWTVNDDAVAHTMIDLGVDMVIGDDPRRLCEVLASR